jgi:hypothetical protein
MPNKLINKKHQISGGQRFARLSSYTSIQHLPSISPSFTVSNNKFLFLDECGDCFHCLHSFFFLYLQALLLYFAGVRPWRQPSEGRSTPFRRLTSPILFYCSPADEYITAARGAPFPGRLACTVFLDGWAARRGGRSSERGFIQARAKGLDQSVGSSVKLTFLGSCGLCLNKLCGIWATIAKSQQEG